MKVTKFIALFVIAVLAFSCQDETVYDVETTNDFSVMKKSASSAKSFMVISKNDQLPANLENQLSNINGTLNGQISQIGIANVESDDPNFAQAALGIKGVDAVVPNLTLDWVKPEEDIQAVSAEYANPPVSGDDDFFFDLQWGHDAIDAPEAWNAGYRGSGVRVAVLDTGFDLDHPDLAPNISPLSMDFTGQGLQFTLSSISNHGSHTAGTIGAADNGYGTIGVAPEVELVLIKVLRDQGSGSLYDILNGIIYAADVDVDVMNMSIGATVEKSGNKEEGYTAADAAWYKNIYSKAITYAYQNGTTVITSAGNEATDYDHTADLIHLPSDAPHAISISATAPVGWGADPSTDLDVFASTYSNYGQSTIDFAAPGGNYQYAFMPGGLDACTVGPLTRSCYVFDYVFSTGNNGWYWSVGTSMAAPHATGVAALIIGKNGGDMKPAQVEAALKRTADDLGKPGNDDYYGAGRVNAYRAVTE
ncbi:MAG: S8 family serine peptidase [Flavobacteriaceae bacterium]|jgi:subtilisin family serine protease|nr:S8 family serine peptidase [Flavobacteriaceae bacterium]MCB0484940.1 S8 family serine peptidase [Flavobacteriaceae bacterium]